MEYKSIGKVIQSLHIELEPEEYIYAQEGTLAYMEDISHNKPCLIDEQRFDRTILILNVERKSKVDDNTAKMQSTNQLGV